MATPVVAPSMAVNLIPVDKIVPDRGLDNVLGVAKAGLPVPLDQNANIDIAAHDLDQARRASYTTDTGNPSNRSEKADEYPSESESNDDGEAATEKPKISEKRRFQNALFSAQYVGRTSASLAISGAYEIYSVSQRAAKVTKDEMVAVVENANNDTLSVRSLIAKQDSSVIITDPREYQIELFEKAKKQNIIAVLDTGTYGMNFTKPSAFSRFAGSGKTLIAVLLLRHILDRELEDRAMGKQHRIAFFLLS